MWQPLLSSQASDKKGVGYTQQVALGGWLETAGELRPSGWHIVCIGSYMMEFGNRLEFELSKHGALELPK